jgi:hypothetical protein
MSPPADVRRACDDEESQNPGKVQGGSFTARKAQRWAILCLAGAWQRFFVPIIDNG